MRPILIDIPLPFTIPILGLHHIPIFSYGVMLGLSMIVGWYIVLGLCERDGMDREVMGKLYVGTAIWSVISARLLYVITNWDRFDHFFDIFKVWEGGLVAYGGFIGGFLYGIIASRFYKIRLLSWADCVVPSLGTGLAFTRIGCFMFGCDYGKPVDPSRVAWAVRFPVGSPAYLEQIKEGLIDRTATSSLPVHPTQIYEMLVGLSLFGLTMLVRRYRKFTGEMFVAFTVGYGVLRFYVETLRADYDRGELGPFSTSQVIGIVTGVLALVFLVMRYRRYKVDPRSTRYWELPPLGTAPPAVATPAESKPGRSKRRR